VTHRIKNLHVPELTALLSFEITSENYQVSGSQAVKINAQINIYFE